MAQVQARRRRLSVGILAGLAAGAFAFGAALGDGPPPRPELASTLSIPRLAGERIVAGFDGPEPPPVLTRAIRAGEVAGVILFDDNLPNRTAGRRLVASLQAIPRPPGLRDPLLVMTDQEGGLVKRIGGAPIVSAEQMGARGAGFSRAQGSRAAANLRNLGINVNLAPVVDVARPGGVIAETDRAFGTSPTAVAATAVPFAQGLQSGGVAATAKHFPGLGAAVENTDFAVQRIDLPKAILRRVDEEPYRAFVAAGGDLVMLSTAIYPALSQQPAAFAGSIASGELRERLGFKGVSITDALETVAVRDFGGPRKAGLAAARAGTDLLLFTDPGEAHQAWSGLVAGLRAGALDREEFEVSAQRVLKLRHRLASG